MTGDDWGPYYRPDDEDSFDVPRWLVPIFWVTIIAVFIAVLLFADGGCYSPELDRAVDCPTATTD